MGASQGGKLSLPLILFIAILAISLACCTSYKKISFPSTFKGDDRQNPLLQGLLTVPAGKGPFPALVLLHGGSGLIRKAYRPWVKRLTDWDYVVLQVDSFSGRNISMENNYGGLPYTYLIKGRARDARDYLAALPGVDPHRIGIIGWSQGGTVVNSIVSESMPAGGFGAAIAFYPQCMLKINDIHAPLLVLIGKKDNVCPAYLCRAMLPLEAASHKLIFITYPGAQHAFDFEAADSERAWGSRHGFKYLYDRRAAADAIDSVQAFLEENLK